jgi:hypothetical protein
MKTIRMVFCFAVLLASVGECQVKVNGQVAAEFFNSTLDSCLVTLVPQSPTAKAESLYTANSGIFSFPSVNRGVYTATAKKAGYKSDSATVVIMQDTVVTFSLLKTSNIITRITSDSLKKANSPYFLCGDVVVSHSLFIEKGVYILVCNTLRIAGTKFGAPGAAGDSIMIKGRDSMNCYLQINALYHNASYCNFSRFQTVDLISDQLFRGVYDKCTFSSINYMNFQSTTNRNYLEIKNSKFLSLITMVESGFDTLRADYNLFSQESNINFTTCNKGHISHNTCLGYMNLMSGNSFDTIANNIFANVSLQKNGTNQMYFAYNDFPENSVTLPGIGTPVIWDDNATPCDLFFNIFEDPGIEDFYTGKLFSSSICIHAAMDGGDIGSWQSDITNGKNAMRMVLVKNRLPKNGKQVHLSETMMNDSRAMMFYSVDGRRMRISQANSRGGNRRRIAAGIYLFREEK